MPRAMTTMLFMVFLLPSAVLSFVNQPSKLSPCVRRQAVQQQQMTMVYDEYDVEGKRKFRWNLNVGRGPFGFAENAEVWNGRVSMIAFVWVLVQELIMGEGIITKFKSAQSVGEVFPLIVVGGTFFLGTFALTAYIAARSDDDDYFSAESVLSDLDKSK